MNLLGALFCFVAGLSYSLRSSFLKDLGKFSISKSSVNLFYRAISLPFIIVIILLAKENILAVKIDFPLFFFVALVTNIAFGLYQVHAFQKHRFSLIEGLAFLDILITTLAGFLFFGEILTQNQTIGIITIILSFIIFTMSEIKEKNSLPIAEIFFYYTFTSAINVVNKQAIKLASPLTFTLYLTIGLILANFLLTFRKNWSIYKWQFKEANKLLILLGVLAATAFISISYAYKLLPVGIVSALISLKVFVSLWLSHKKYQEKNLRLKIIASVIAFVGTILLFI